MKLTIAFIFCFSITVPSFVYADTYSEVNILINKYGKEKIIDYICQKRNGIITVTDGGNISEIDGPPDSKYVNANTITRDFAIIKTSPNEVKRLLTDDGHAKVKQLAVNRKSQELEQKRIHSIEKNFGVCVSTCTNIKEQDFVPPTLAGCGFNDIKTFYTSLTVYLNAKVCKSCFEIDISPSPPWSDKYTLPQATYENRCATSTGESIFAKYSDVFHTAQYNMDNAYQEMVIECSSKGLLTNREYRELIYLDDKRKECNGKWKLIGSRKKKD